MALQGRAAERGNKRLSVFLGHETHTRRHTLGWKLIIFTHMLYPATIPIHYPFTVNKWGARGKFTHYNCVYVRPSFHHNPPAQPTTTHRFRSVIMMLMLMVVKLMKKKSQPHPDQTPKHTLGMYPAPECGAAAAVIWCGGAGACTKYSEGGRQSDKLFRIYRRIWAKILIIFAWCWWVWRRPTLNMSKHDEGDRIKYICLNEEV